MNSYKFSLLFFLVSIIASDATAQNNFQYRFELETPRMLNSTQQQITRNGDNYFFVHQDSTETGVIISVISIDGINTSNLFFTNLSNEPQLPVYTSTPSNLFSGSNRKSVLLSNASAYDQSGVAFKYYVNFNVIDSTGAPILFKTWKIEQNSISNMHVSDAVLSSDEQYIFACALLSDSTGIPVESALIKSDWSGQIQWVRSWPANNYYLPAITVDNQNNIYMSEYNSLVTGTKIMKWNSAGSLIWEKQFSPNAASSLVFHDISFNNIKHRLGLAGTFTDNATMKWSPMMLEVDSAGNFVQANRYDSNSIYEGGFSGIHALPSGGWAMRIDKQTAVISLNDGWRIGLLTLDPNDTPELFRFYQNWTVHYNHNNNFIVTDDGYAFMGYDDSYNSYLVKTDVNGMDSCDYIDIFYSQIATTFTTSTANDLFINRAIVEDIPLHLMNPVAVTFTTLCKDSIPLFTGLQENIAANELFSVEQNLVSGNQAIHIINRKSLSGILQFIDVRGRLIGQSRFGREEYFQADNQNLSAGYYLLRFITDEGIEVKKLVVKN